MALEKEPQEQDLLEKEPQEQGALEKPPTKPKPEAAWDVPMTASDIDDIRDAYEKAGKEMPSSLAGWMDNAYNVMNFLKGASDAG